MKERSISRIRITIVYGASIPKETLTLWLVTTRQVSREMETRQRLLSFISQKELPSIPKATSI